MGMCLRFPGSLGCGRQDAGKTECVCRMWVHVSTGAQSQCPRTPVDPTSFLSPGTSFRVFTGPS